MKELLKQLTKQKRLIFFHRHDNRKASWEENDLREQALIGITQLDNLEDVKEIARLALSTKEIDFERNGI